MFTVPEAAALMRLGKRTVWRMVASGEIVREPTPTPCTIATAIHVPPADLLARTAGAIRAPESPARQMMADCLAGVWAHNAQKSAGWRLEDGDIEEALNAAAQIGDDTLQREAQGRVVPDSFTHGTSAERMKWLKRGLDNGDPAQCDTFSGAI